MSTRAGAAMPWWAAQTHARAGWMHAGTTGVISRKDGTVRHKVGRTTGHTGWCANPPPLEGECIFNGQWGSATCRVYGHSGPPKRTPPQRGATTWGVQPQERGGATTGLYNHRGVQPRMYMARAAFSPFLYFNQYKEWRKFISQSTTSHPH